MCRKPPETGGNTMPSVDYKINDSYYQSNSASCWYAAYCMLYDWKGQPTSAIREKIEASTLGAAGYADAWRNGLREEDYPTVRAALGLWGFRRMYFATLADDLDYFGKNLKDYGPFWCALHSDASNSDHGVVVCGVNVDAKTIHVMNPWGTTGTAESQYYTAAGFKSRLGSKDVASAAQMFP
jgi:hypothetical protein